MKLIKKIKCKPDDRNVSQEIYIYGWIVQEIEIGRMPATLTIQLRISDAVLISKLIIYNWHLLPERFRPFFSKLN
jgi:hypothetical protein